MTLAVAEALNPNTPNQPCESLGADIANCNDDPTFHMLLFWEFLHP